MSSEDGSTTTGGSTSPPYIPSCNASTNIWCVGPAENTNDSAATQGGHGRSSRKLREGIRTCSLTGVSASDHPAGRWEPCKSRGLRTVLREPGGEIPPGYSPDGRIVLRGTQERAGLSHPVPDPETRHERRCPVHRTPIQFPTSPLGSRLQDSQRSPQRVPERAACGVI